MRNYSFTIILISLLTACNKDNKHPIPDIPIYVEAINIYDPEYNALAQPFGKFLLKDVGYLNNGIIVVNLGNDEFKAYDATCTYELKEGCNVEIDEGSSLLVKCSCCDSKYEITYGAVSQGPSNIPLKEYNTIFSDGILRIYN